MAQLDLSLPRKSVISLTDRLDMAIDVDWDNKTQQHQQQQSLLKPLTQKRLTQKWIVRMAVVSVRHNIKIYPTIQCKFLLILKMWVPILIGTYWMQCIEFGLSFFFDMVADMVA